MHVINYRRKIYVVLDEIYALSIFDENCKYKSVLAMDQIPDPARTIWTWGLSKDFGLAGLRTSFFYVENQEISSIIDRLSVYNCVPSFVHGMVENLLSDFSKNSKNFKI